MDSDKKRDQAGSDEILEELIFNQDLNEVHLLIDLVSSRADRTLRGLSMSDPTNPDKTMTAGEIIEAIAEMRYPPDGTRAANARNAAILLVAKDQLSSLAAPASGLSIAYTRMFINQEGSILSLQNLRRWFKREEPPAPQRDTRIHLAQNSYPSLQAHAHKFRLWRDGLTLFLLFWLVLTAVAYRDAGLGRAALERLDQDWKSVVGELSADPTLIACTQEADASAAPPSSDDAGRRQFACRKYRYLTIVAKTAGTQVNDVFRCANMHPIAKIGHVWCWHWLLSGNAGIQPQEVAAKAEPAANSRPEAVANKVSPYARANVTYWQTATSFLVVFATYILPMMFALLGTFIGTFRALLNRIAASELSPRDLVRMKIGIPTGLVAGIAVGLFLSPTSVPIQGAGGVSGQLTLTASGFGFLAGYASHSFFGFLDNMIRNVFPFGSSPNPAAAPPPAQARA